MVYSCIYKTPSEFSNLVLQSNGEFLTGLWFENSKDSFKYKGNSEEKNLPIFDTTIKWLDIYFSGRNPDFTPKYKTEKLTSFRQEVNEIMNTISFGNTMSYNEIAKLIACKRGIKKMSAQAVGRAVGANKICLIIPCHRVVGADGNLTGYGGGIKNKVELLKLEKVDMGKYFIPKKI